MRFSTPLLALLTFSTSTLALPTLAPRALVATTYNDFQVSDGVAGNALAEVNAKFPIDQTNLAGVSASDLAHISAAAKVSESAEVDKGGFNDAVAAASGTAATTLQVGKIKNKVLKLQTDVLRLQIQAAQGKTGLDAQIKTQQTKLATNVALDVKAKGQASKGISFAGTS